MSDAEGILYPKRFFSIRVRAAIAEGKGWSLAAVADEMGIAYNTAQKWKAGDRNPSNAKAVLQSLDLL